MQSALILRLKKTLTIKTVLPKQLELRSSQKMKCINAKKMYLFYLSCIILHNMLDTIWMRYCCMHWIWLRWLIRWWWLIVHLSSCRKSTPTVWPAEAKAKKVKKNQDNLDRSYPLKQIIHFTLHDIIIDIKKNKNKGHKCNMRHKECYYLNYSKGEQKNVWCNKQKPIKCSDMAQISVHPILLNTERRDKNNYIVHWPQLMLWFFFSTQLIVSYCFVMLWVFSNENTISNEYLWLMFCFNFFFFYNTYHLYWPL